MKKNTIYISIAAVAGIFLGYILFSNPSSEKDKAHSHAENGQTWTCSMHPQIMQPQPGDCPICGMDLIPASSSSEENKVNPNQFQMTANAIALANIQTTTIGGQIEADNTITLSGKIKANEDETYIQPAHFNGRIEKLYVESVGETVHKGQAIAIVYSPELIGAQQELITAYKMRNTQPRLYEAVKNKFKNWMIPQKEIDKIITTGKIKNKFTIYSHISGTVTKLDVTEGSHIMDGKPIFETAALNTVWAVFDAYEKQIPHVKEGQKITITTNVFPDKKIEKEITYVDPILNTQTRTVEVRTILQNKEKLLKPGMFVEGSVKVHKNTETKQLYIPASAVMWTGKRSIVYVKQSGDVPVFEMRPVEIGNKNGEYYTVLSGLQNGEEIVTQGTFTVDAAAQLKGKTSMMNN